MFKEADSRNIIETAAYALNKSSSDIIDVTILKKGMTNHSILFSCDNVLYIMRTPGEGTAEFINRTHEYEVYNTIRPFDISDEIVYLNPKTGIKISKYLSDATVCDPRNQMDLKKAIGKLKYFHSLDLKVNHTFDIFNEIDYYESLCKGVISMPSDYKEIKEKILSLKQFIEDNTKSRTLCHIDSVPDNFLITGDDVKIIDWEYAGMQDPHLDIAMFSVYSNYNKEEIDNLIDIYFDNNCPDNIRIKIYSYVAACGFLWSNWCEYKKKLGVNFEDYELSQYSFAKEFSKLASEKINIIC